MYICARNTGWWSWSNLLTTFLNKHTMSFIKTDQRINGKHTMKSCDISHFSDDKRRDVRFGESSSCLTPHKTSHKKRERAGITRTYLTGSERTSKIEKPGRHSTPNTPAL